MFYVLVFLVLTGIIMNAIYNKFVMRNITYKREICKKVVEIDEEFDIVTIIENKKIIPVTYLKIIETIPDILKYKLKSGNMTRTINNTYHKTSMMILPFQRITRNYKVSCSQRGRVTIKNINLTAGDLLGFKTYTKDLELLQDIIVMPKAFDIDNEIVPYGNYNGDFSVHRWIIDDPVLTVGVREYTGSEPVKTIHWPSSLKSGKLMVKKFDYTSDNTVMVVLNMECSSPYWTGDENEKNEKCISITRSVIDQFVDKGIPYSLISNANFVGAVKSYSVEPPGSGVVHYYDSMEKLGRLSYDICISFEEIISELLKSNGLYTTFAVITPSVLEPYVELINRLNQSSMKTILISLGDDNLDYLSNDIYTYIEAGNAI